MISNEQIVLIGILGIISLIVVFFVFLLYSRRRISSGPKTKNSTYILQAFHRHKFQTLLVFIGIILALTQVFATAKLLGLPQIPEAKASSTLGSILVLIGPLLGVVGAFAAFLYKDLDDRRMSLEEKLLTSYSDVENEDLESVRDQIDGKISGIKSELDRVKINIVSMFSFFLATIVSCFYNKDFVPEYLAGSTVRLVVPEGFLLVSIFSIILLILSFHIPEPIDPSQGINQARRSAPLDPYGSIIRSFLAAEEATRDFLAKRDEPVTRFTSYVKLQNSLSKVDDQLGEKFGSLRQVRNSIVHGKTIPNVRQALDFSERVRRYLKMLNWSS